MILSLYLVYKRFKPLKMSVSDSTYAQEVELMLKNRSTNLQEGVMKHIFDRLRQKARTEIEDLLADFRSKRTLGNSKFTV